MVYKSKYKNFQPFTRRSSIPNQKNSKFDAIDIAILVALIIPFIPP